MGVGPLCALADEVLTAPVGSQFVFDSHAGPAVLCAALLQAMLDALPTGQQAHLDQFEAAAARRRVFLADLKPSLSAAAERRADQVLLPGRLLLGQVHEASVAGNAVAVAVPGDAHDARADVDQGPGPVRPGGTGSTDNQEMTATPTPSAARPRIAPLSLAAEQTLLAASSRRPRWFSMERTSRIWRR